MNEVRTLSNRNEISPTRPGFITRTAGRALAGLGRKALLGQLAKLKYGVFVIEENGTQHRFGNEANDGLNAHVRVHDPRFWTEMLAGGTIGSGEAYRQRWWTADDLTQVVRIFVRNRSVMESMEGGFAALAAPVRKFAHWTNRNTLRGSQRNIEAHYDLSNDFFELILDPTMCYSSGIFPHESASMEDASVEKMDRLCRKLELKPGDRLLEIGTGWGALAAHAAKEYGACVTTTTISAQQAEWAARRFEQEGVTSQVQLLRHDYRELQGKFDKVVSVEMIEAVGWKYFDSFFSVVAERLTDDGVAAIQAITIADQYYDEARQSVDFIQKYIFPGSCIPSIGALLASATRASDLKMVHLEDITPHYCRTLAYWREQMFAHQEQVLELGLDEHFLRTWDYYFSYCEGGFAEQQIGTVQLLMSKPQWRGQAPLPSLTTP